MTKPIEHHLIGMTPNEANNFLNMIGAGYIYIDYDGRYPHFKLLRTAEYRTNRHNVSLGKDGRIVEYHGVG